MKEERDLIDGKYIKKDNKGNNDVKRERERVFSGGKLSN